MKMTSVMYVIVRQSQVLFLPLTSMFIIPSFLVISMMSFSPMTHLDEFLSALVLRKQYSRPKSKYVCKVVSQ